MAKNPPSNVQSLVRKQLPHASRPKSQNIKQKQYYNKLNKDLNTWSISLKILKKKKKKNSKREDRDGIKMGEEVEGESTTPINTFKIHLHMEQFSLKTRD